MRALDGFLLAAVIALAPIVYDQPLLSRPAASREAPGVDRVQPNLERLLRGEDRFTGGALNRYAMFDDGGSRWKVAGGELVGSGPSIQSVLVRRGERMEDGWVEAVSRRADDGGLVLRFKDPTDYYLLAFRDDAAPAPRGEYNLAVYHHVGGEYRELWRKNVRWPRGTAATIRFQAFGPWFSVWFDGVRVGSLVPGEDANDPFSHAGSGGFGLRVYGDDPRWVTKFSAFRWGRLYATPVIKAKHR